MYLLRIYTQNVPATYMRVRVVARVSQHLTSKGDLLLILHYHHSFAFKITESLRNGISLLRTVSLKPLDLLEDLL